MAFSHTAAFPFVIWMFIFRYDAQDFSVSTVRTAIGILNERRLALKSQGCTLENSEEYVGVFNLLSRFLDLLSA